MIYGEQAFKRFFKGLTAFPVFKKKGRNELGAYFVKNNKKDFEFYRHKIKIPTLKFVRVKEYRYIPKNAIIKSGTITKIADRYFLSLIIEVDDIVKTKNKKYTPISIRLNIGTTMITGANMGGKSVALKTIAENVLLFQMGFFVFAKYASIPLLDFIFFVSDDVQDISKGLSTFGAEIIKLKEKRCERIWKN